MKDEKAASPLSVPQNKGEPKKGGPKMTFALMPVVLVLLILGILAGVGLGLYFRNKNKD